MRMPRRSLVAALSAALFLILGLRNLASHPPPRVRSRAGDASREREGPPIADDDVVPSRPAASSSPPPHRDAIDAWTSPHLVDCTAPPWDPGGDGSDGNEGAFHFTRTDPPFAMNVHDPSTDGISREIAEKGCWECAHVAGVLRALGTYDGSYFLDVGGNIGMWSLAAAAAGHQTFTIEALSVNARRFCGTVNRNGFHDRTHLLRVAATSEPRRFRMDVPRGNLGGTRVVAVAAGSDADDGDDGRDVAEGVPIDSLSLPTDRPVAMKVDVEGHELEALWGAREFLERAEIVYAAMELRPNLARDPRWGEIFTLFSSKGLRPYRVNYEDETPLDAGDLRGWRHFKHPIVLYYDVVWRRDDFGPLELAPERYD